MAARSPSHKSLTNEKLLNEFRELVKIFHKELRRARKALRSHFIAKGLDKKADLTGLYGDRGGWTALSGRNFLREVESVKNQLEKEDDWLQRQLQRISWTLRSGKQGEIPFEDLEAALMEKHPAW